LEEVVLNVLNSAGLLKGRLLLHVCNSSLNSPGHLLNGLLKLFLIGTQLLLINTHLFNGLLKLFLSNNGGEETSEFI
jgi:hypothetical protein